MAKSEKTYVGCTRELIDDAAKAALVKYPKHEDVIRALRFTLLDGEVPSNKGSGFYKAASTTAVVKFLGGDKAESLELIAAAVKAGAVKAAAVFGYMRGVTMPGIDAPPPVSTAAEKLAAVREKYGDI